MYDRASFITVALLLGMTAAAQPQWRFHLAFEDGTGARDTVWFIYDTSATLPLELETSVDYELGEGPAEFAPGEFHVFLLNAEGDTTQHNAFPYSWFPIFQEPSIDAINWTPPMTISWDSSMFHAPFLPYEQGSFGIAIMDGLAFSQFPGGPGFGMYDMLIDNSVSIDFLWDYLFPFGMYFGPDDDIGLGHGASVTGSVVLYPNPASSELYIRYAEQVLGLQVFDALGRVVYREPAHPTLMPIDISHLAPGIYSIRTNSINHELSHATFQKVDQR